MSDFPDKNTPVESIEQQAAVWVLRCDRGLTAEEQDDFFQWLAADPRHGVALARYRRHWSRLDKLVQWRPEHGVRPNPDLLAPPAQRRSSRLIPFLLSIPAAAAIILAFVIFKPDRSTPDSPLPIAAGAPIERHRLLPDGSVIELNRGAEVETAYRSDERRILLKRGEAYFTVAKDSDRPFIVSVDGIDVRAVGTAFNIRFDAAAVEVLVTAGSVRVDSPRDGTTRPGMPGERRSEAPIVPLLEMNQRVVVPLSGQSEPPRISVVTPDDIERALAWKHRMLEFAGVPLADILAEFNRRNDIQLILVDEDLASVSISGSIRSDNIDGFLRLLETGFGARVERRGESEILLRKPSEW